MFNIFQKDKKKEIDNSKTLELENSVKLLKRELSILAECLYLFLENEDDKQKIFDTIILAANGNVGLVVEFVLKHDRKGRIRDNLIEWIKNKDGDTVSRYINIVLFEPVDRS